MVGRWVDAGEAAEELGICTEAVRKRLSRGSLDPDRPNGHVLVRLDDDSTEAGRGDHPAYDELVASKEETISILQDRLRAEEIQRRDVLFSQLTQATSNLTDRLRGLEAPATATDTPQAFEESAQEPVETSPSSAPCALSTEGAERHTDRGGGGCL